MSRPGRLLRESMRDPIVEAIGAVAAARYRAERARMVGAVAAEARARITAGEDPGAAARWIGPEVAKRDLELWERYVAEAIEAATPVAPGYTGTSRVCLCVEEVGDEADCPLHGVWM